MIGKTTLILEYIIKPKATQNVLNLCAPVQSASPQTNSRHPSRPTDTEM